MRLLLTSYLVSLGMIASVNGQWTMVNEGFDQNLYSFDFIDDVSGWMLGESAVYRTTDGGQTWSTYPLGMDLGYGLIAFVNDSVGWMQGDSAVYRTTGGGSSWETIWTLSNHVTEMQAVNDSVAVIMTEIGIMKTTDAGLTWEKITPIAPNVSIHSMSFTDPYLGVVAGTNFDQKEVIYATYDGGINWNELVLPELREIREIRLMDKLYGYFLASVDSFNILVRTTDGFHTWEIINKQPSNFGNSIHACHFFTRDTCLVILEDSVYSQIIKSTNGGNTWSSVDNVKLPLAWEYAIDCTAGNECYILGYRRGQHSNVLMRSPDRGDSWSMMKYSYPFKDVSISDPHNIIFVGGETEIHGAFGEIIHTTDGGDLWSFPMSKSIGFTNCSFINDVVGYASGGVVRWGGYAVPSELYKTTDGGMNWTLSEPDLGENTVLHFLDEQIGFAYNGDVILMTNNGGMDWTEIPKSETLCVEDDIVVSGGCYSMVYSAVSSGESTFWAVSEEKLVKFELSGEWEYVSVDTDLPLQEVYFIDEHTGWIRGGYVNEAEGIHTILLKTEDGGLTWTKRDDLQYFLNDFHFTDKQLGWALGVDEHERGVILKTTNGGDEWSVEAGPLMAPLNALDFKDGQGWAAGEKGLVLKMVDSTLVSRRNHEILDPADHPVVRIYPNPGSSYMNINTSIYDRYEVVIYGLSGQEIRRNRFTGTEGLIDLSSFPDGAYVVTLRSDNLIAHRKIIKL